MLILLAGTAAALATPKHQLDLGVAAGVEDLARPAPAGRSWSVDARYARGLGGAWHLVLGVGASQTRAPAIEGEPLPDGYLLSSVATARPGAGVRWMPEWAVAPLVEAQLQAVPMRARFHGGLDGRGVDRWRVGLGAQATVGVVGRLGEHASVTGMNNKTGGERKQVLTRGPDRGNPTPTRQGRGAGAPARRASARSREGWSGRSHRCASVSNESEAP